MHLLCWRAGSRCIPNHSVKTCTQIPDDQAVHEQVMAIFLLSPKFFGGYFFHPILLFYYQNVYLSPTTLYAHFGTDTLKIPFIHITLDTSGPRGFFVEHIETGTT